MCAFGENRVHRVRPPQEGHGPGLLPLLPKFLDRKAAWGECLSPPPLEREEAGTSLGTGVSPLCPAGQQEDTVPRQSESHIGVHSEMIKHQIVDDPE